MQSYLSYRFITNQNPIYSKCLKLRRDRLWQPLHLLTSVAFEKIEDESVFIVALVNSRQPVACLMLTPEPQNKWIRLSQLVVNEKYCRQGVGSKLVGMAFSYARKEKHERMAVYVHHDILPFFEKFGFVSYGKWYSHVNKMRSILMIKDLRLSDL